MKKAFLLSIIAFASIAELYAQANTIGPVRHESDPALKAPPLATKKLHREIATAAAPHVFIKYMYNSLEIRSWKENKVSISTNVTYAADKKYTEEELWKKSSIELSGGDGSVKIKTLPVNAGTIYTKGKTTTITGNNTAGKFTPPSATEKTTVIYVPEQSTLELETEYTDVLISSFFTTLDIRINSGNIEGTNAGNVKLQAKYSNVNLGDLQELSMRFENGKFKAKNTLSLNAATQSSAIELNNIKKGIVESNNDEYEMLDVNDIQLNKQYGSLRIENLTGQLAFEGTNSDVRIRRIAPAVSAVSINNKFASISIPCGDLTNYLVDFKGQYATIYAPFERMPVRETTANTIDAPLQFKTAVGNTKATHTRFFIRCDKCIVDFK
jgi:hypothetical protein